VRQILLEDTPSQHCRNQHSIMKEYLDCVKSTVTANTSFSITIQFATQALSPFPSDEDI